VVQNVGISVLNCWNDNCTFLYKKEKIMTIFLIKTKKRELFKVNNQVFTKEDNASMFNHLRNKISEEKPISVGKNFHNGRHNGKIIKFEVKGSLPQYGFKLQDVLSRGQKSKLYNKFNL
jgi:hypothetical protein